MIKKLKYNKDDGSKSLIIFNIVLVLFSIINFIYTFSIIKYAIDLSWAYDIKDYSGYSDIYNSKVSNATYNLSLYGNYYKFISIICLLFAIVFIILAVKKKRKIISIILSSLTIIINLLLLFILFKV